MAKKEAPGPHQQGTEAVTNGLRKSSLAAAEQGQVEVGHD